MKRFAALFLFPLFAILPLNAQSEKTETEVDPGSTAIDVVVKRCFSQGNDVMMDLVVTGKGGWKVVAFLNNHCVFYDDEGNRYMGGLVNMGYQLLFEVDKNRHNQCHLDIERDIPRKVRLILKDVDEYAASFPLIKLRYYGDNTSYNDCTMVIKNLPIDRDN
ncbi:MAG: hypothetical protein IKH49_00840 [Bacteroidales bacterium]|nr:hypothetical protein [Bacteroidales bacterium]